MVIETPEEAALARLVRREPIGPALAACDGEKLRRLAMAHLVLSPLAARIDAEEGIESRWRKWCAVAGLSAGNDAMRCGKARARTIGILEPLGLAPIVLKGPSLSFGRPRDEGDVDILIPEAALSDAIAALESAGYRYRGFERNFFIRPGEFRDWKKLSRWSVQFEFAEPESGALVELHIGLFDTGRMYDEDLTALREAVSEIAAASVVDRDSGLRFLSLEDRALLLAVHAGVKRSPSNLGFVLRHVLDLEALVEAGVDWEQLERRAFRYGVAHHLLLLLRLSEAVAGFLPTGGAAERIEARLPRRAVRLVGLHESCMATLSRASRASRFAYRFLSPFVLRGTVRARIRALLIVPLLVPRPFELAVIYGLPRRTRWAFFLYAAEPLRLLLRLARKARNALSAP